MGKIHIQELWEKVQKYCEDNKPKIYQAMISSEKASDADFKIIENIIGCSLPMDFKNSYMINNTDMKNSPFGKSGMFKSIKEIYNSILENQQDWTNEDGTEAYDIDSKNIVPPQVFWPKEWVEFGSIFGNVLLLLDLREEMGEYKGGVIVLDTNDGELVFVYPSFEECLKDAVTQLLEKNEYDDYTAYCD